MTHDQLFLKTLDDIKIKMNGDEYDLIKACGLLRHLICDKTSLLEIVNREYRLKIVFTVCDKTPPDNYLFAYWVDLSYLKEKTKTVSVDEFLSLRMFTFVDMCFSVKDIIRVGSHVQGGVHSGEAENPDHKVLSVLDDKVFRQQDFGKKSIKSICTVVLSGLEPLKNLIKGHTPAGGF
jgi:hypothetical protein